MNSESSLEKEVLLHALERSLFHGSSALHAPVIKDLLVRVRNGEVVGPHAEESETVRADELRPEHIGCIAYTPQITGVLAGFGDASVTEELQFTDLYFTFGSVRVYADAEVTVHPPVGLPQ